jgi:hypothetical protein
MHIAMKPGKLLVMMFVVATPQPQNADLPYAHRTTGRSPRPPIHIDGQEMLCRDLNQADSLKPYFERCCLCIDVNH